MKRSPQTWLALFGVVILLRMFWSLLFSAGSCNDDEWGLRFRQGDAGAIQVEDRVNRLIGADWETEGSEFTLRAVVTKADASCRGSGYVLPGLEIRGKLPNTALDLSTPEELEEETLTVSTAFLCMDSNRRMLELQSDATVHFIRFPEGIYAVFSGEFATADTPTDTETAETMALVIATY